MRHLHIVSVKNSVRAKLFPTLWNYTRFLFYSYCSILWRAWLPSIFWEPDGRDSNPEPLSESAVLFQLSYAFFGHGTQYEIKWQTLFKITFTPPFLQQNVRKGFQSAQNKLKVYTLILGYVGRRRYFRVTPGTPVCFSASRWSLQFFMGNDNKVVELYGWSAAVCCPLYYTYF